MFPSFMRAWMFNGVHEGGVSMLNGIFDGIEVTGVAGSFICAGFVGFTWDVKGRCITIGVVSVARSVSIGNTTVGFTVASLCIRFDSP